MFLFICLGKYCGGDNYNGIPIQCPVGHIANTSGQISCSVCGPTTYASNDRQTCLPCVAGMLI